MSSFHFTAANQSSTYREYVMEQTQNIDQPVNTTAWLQDEEHPRYPEGARDKALLYCPDRAPYPFLKTNHRYLYKRSSPKYPEQFWVEVLAYRLGAKMNIEVPPAFVAYNTDENTAAALIEWFLLSDSERSIPGGDFCQQQLPSFDRKKGKQHNVEMLQTIFREIESENKIQLHWEKYWSKALLFDALIGNTDRHQENWCIIETPHADNQTQTLRFCPVFDNGTSMGHEIPATDFEKFKDPKYVERYVSRGWHHLRWNLHDPKAMKHIPMLMKWVQQHPETRKIMLSCLDRINHLVFEDTLNHLMSFRVPIPLTTARATLMLELLRYRHKKLLETLTCH
ncbi:MAG: HipA domain-containing protein [Methylococcales bacterium]|nr:HipA domain-containing protein [Methylococcales bacterium]